ncbi:MULTISPECIES: enoyl-CoA hydratase [Clostridia]|uniref:enoyl-CoA hydratase n=1 Tax=Clostridia TaxID=186801 RepID=UPI000EA01002|nr:MULTISPECIES: enoyl-CoA hydratase [Clostridia]NBJ68947.1 enoyl-CoA hydratase [Roseburia sp. 1XD42-34]RKI79851.1 enoyl-CoA hydratase [Clostridium sp. 1xD42-85]
MTKSLDLEITNSVAYVTIKSPPANALSSSLLQDLAENLDEVETKTSIKAVVLKGEGRFFSAGADIKEFTTLQKASDYESMAKRGQDLFDRMEQFHIPIIAAIHGAALGGGLELAMACHMRIVTKSAKLGLPEITLGIIPGFAGTQRLPHYVGSAKAYEMILTGEPISGEEAYSYGLANKVVTEETLEEEAKQLAEKIATKSKLTIQQIMQLIPYAKTGLFAEGVSQEAKAFGQIFGSDDAKEGVQAFIDKRKPNFQDK